MLYTFLFLLGILLGSIIAAILIRKNSVGSLKVASDEDDTYLFVEFSTDPTDVIKHNKYVTFKVDLTQK